MTSSGPWTQLNKALIPTAAPGSSEGHAYTWLDATAAPGVAYAYLLEDVALDGTTARHPPVTTALTAADAAPNAVGLAKFTALRQVQAANWAAGLVALAVLAGAARAGLRRKRRG